MKISTVLASLLLLTCIAAAAPATGPFAVYSTKEEFGDVMDSLRLAIEEKGLYINNVMHMSEMLDRTAKDLGFKDRLYLQAESIEFCSASLSRRMMAEDPRRIANCPFVISVYVLPAEPDKTYVVHRRLSPRDQPGIMGEVETILEYLANAATEGF